MEPESTKTAECGETLEYTVPLIKAPFMLDTVVLMSERWQSPSRYSNRGLVLLRHWMTEFMKHCIVKNNALQLMPHMFGCIHSLEHTLEAHYSRRFGDIHSFPIWQEGLKKTHKNQCQ
jgi:hypothetical protein